MDMPSLHFQLFGIPEVRDANQNILPLKTAQGALALYLLVLQTEEISRDDMARYIWASDVHASRLTNLRQQYVQLRKGLGIHANRLVTRKIVPRTYLEHFELTNVHVDAWEMDARIAQAENTQNIGDIRQVFALYRGDLLRGYDQPYVHKLRTKYFRKLLLLSQLAREQDRVIEEYEEGKMLERWVNDYPTDEIIARQWLEWLADHEEFDRLKVAYRKIQSNCGKHLEQRTTTLYHRLLQENRVIAVAPLPESKLPRLETIPVAPPLIGREEDVRKLGRAVALESLVTIFGSGGIGKTHLAKQIAEQFLTEKRDGVAFVDLTYLPAGASEESIKSHIATKLGTSSTNVDIALHNRILLLILDNAEHLLGSLSLAVTSMLSHNRGLSILVTSREPLGLAQEHRYQLPPLALPPRPAQVTIRTAQESPSIQLFLSRITDTTFRLHSSNVATVSQICWLLEGIPLALELAAAAVEPYVPLENLAEYLKEHLLLVGHTPTDLSDIHARHRTMERTLLWSYDTLSEREQQFLIHISVLQGTASILALSQVSRHDIQTTTRLAQRLHHKSLLTISPLSLSGTTRYYLLEPVRQFATQRLQENVEEYAQVQERHLHFFVALAEETQTDLQTLVIERENLHHALRHAIQRADADAAAKLVVALSKLSVSKGGFPVVYPDILASESSLYVASPPWNSLAVKQLGNAAFLSEDLDTASRCSEWCLQDAEAREDTRSRAAALGNWGNVAMKRGDMEHARTLFRECIQTFHSLELESGEMMAWDNLANLEANTGNLELSLEHQGKALSIMRKLAQTRQLQYIHALGQGLNNQIYTLLELRDDETTKQRFHEVLSLCLEWELPPILVHTFTLLVNWLIVQQKEEEAIWVLGASEALRENYSIPTPEPAYTKTTEQITRLKVSLGEVIFEEQFNKGRESSGQETRLIQSAMDIVLGEGGQF
jgi:predicted ATPase/DNA-binding SARP family transcriptional activator